MTQQARNLVQYFKNFIIKIMCVITIVSWIRRPLKPTFLSSKEKLFSFHLSSFTFQQHVIIGLSLCLRIIGTVIFLFTLCITFNLM